MTARHVAFQPKTLACKIKVRAGGRWIAVVSRHRWATRGGVGKLEDIATLKLARPVVGAHIFTIATSPPRKWTNLAMVGHPLGNAISLTQGPLLSRYTESHVPFLVMNLLGGEGASGSAIVNERGNVVGILQRGAGSEDPLGEITGGLVFGIDLAKVWDSASRRALCRGYPAGGIPYCVEQSASLSVTGVSLQPSGSGGATACAIETAAAVPCLTVPASETQVTIGLAFDVGAVEAHALSSSIVGPAGSGAAPAPNEFPRGRSRSTARSASHFPCGRGHSWSWTVRNSSSGTADRTGAVAFTVLPGGSQPLSARVAAAEPHVLRVREEVDDLAARDLLSGTAARTRPAAGRRGGAGTPRAPAGCRAGRSRTPPGRRRAARPDTTARPRARPRGSAPAGSRGTMQSVRYSISS